MSRAYRLILLGPPGSGKGTQGKILAKRFGIPHLAAGDILRQEIAAKTPLGEKVQRILERGDLVDDRVIVEIMERRMVASDCSRGWILDGYPRKVSQAEALDRFLTRNQTPLTAAVLLDLGEVNIQERLLGRLVCSSCGQGFQRTLLPPKRFGVCDLCGEKVITRNDDTESTIRARIAVYHRETEPLVQYYKEKDLLLVIPAKALVKKVTEDICSLIESRHDRPQVS